MPIDTSMIDLVSLIEQETGIRFGKAYGTGEKRTQKGPCPWCGGTVRLAVFVNDTPQRFLCGIHGHGCGHRGDAIDFIRQWADLDFFTACGVLNLDPGSEYVRSERVYTPDVLTPPSEVWQKQARGWIHQAQRVLWSKYGVEALAYLHSRGFTDETIRQAQLGYIPFKDAAKPYFHREKRSMWGLPEPDDEPWLYFYEGILIPAYVDGQLWGLTVRRLNNLAPNDPRYLSIKGSVSALYNADSICSDTPVILSESALDALSGIQTCEGLNVAFVATGSTKGAQDPLWIARLNKAPYTLIAFDDDENKAGHEGASYWLSTLNHHYQILPWAKDINQMLIAGMDLREWVASGMAEYEAIQASKEIALSSVVDPLPASSPAQLAPDINILVDLLTEPEQEIPASFSARPCDRCGRIGQARRRQDDGRWMCVCYQVEDFETARLGKAARIAALTVKEVA